MARLTDTQRDNLVADYHTGQYTQRELAKKYKVSTATVNKMTKGVHPKHEQRVNAVASVYAELQTASEAEVNAVFTAIEDKTAHLRVINANAMKLANKLALMADEISEAGDLKLLADANDKLAITLKVAERHAPKIDVNQTLAQQNNDGQTVIQIVKDTKDAV